VFHDYAAAEECFRNALRSAYIFVCSFAVVDFVLTVGCATVKPNDVTTLNNYGSLLMNVRKDTDGALKVTF
jgi:hypothetical protein